MYTCNARSIVQLLVCCCLLWLAHSVALASASDVGNVEVRYCLEDEDLQTLEQAKRCRYGHYGDLSLDMRFTAIRWVSVSASITEPTQRLTINVAPYLLSQIEIFDASSAQLLAGPVGSDYDYSAKHGLLAGYTFTVDPREPGRHTYFIRIVTQGVPYSFVQASLDPVGTQKLSQRVGLGIHFGVLGLLTIISISFYIATRNKTVGVLALNVLTLFLSVMLGSGFLFAYVWPNWPHFNVWLFTSLFYIKPALWVWLAQTFLAPYRTPAWYQPSCNAVYLAVIGMLVLSWLGLFEVSNVLMLVIGLLVSPLLQLVAMHKTTGIRPIYKRLLMLGYLFGALALWVAILITFYPTNNPALPILVTRIVDYTYPLVLGGLVAFHYRETIRQLALAQAENSTIRLGLEFESKLRDERKLMVDMLTHELKNPLASISLAMGSLTSAFKDSNPQVQRRLQNIDQSVRSMDAVIERCNLMNQLDQSTLQCEPVRIDVSAVVTSVIERFANGDRVLLTAETIKRFATDPQFFQMIVSNLIENALKYSAANSAVTVKVSLDHAASIQRLSVTVTNKIGSKGFPDPSLVFTRFYRHAQAHNTAGSGVGLYLAQALAELLGGRINYQHDSRHVVFRLELPEAIAHD